MTYFKFNFYQDEKKLQENQSCSLNVSFILFDFFSYIILGNQTHIRYADRENMEDDVAQPVLRNHPDRMESTEGLKLIITSSRIIKCPQ